MVAAMEEAVTVVEITGAVVMIVTNAASSIYCSVSAVKKNNTAHDHHAWHSLVAPANDLRKNRENKKLTRPGIEGRERGGGLTNCRSVQVCRARQCTAVQKSAAGGGGLRGGASRM